MKRILLISIATTIAGCASAQKKNGSTTGGVEPPKLLKPEVEKIWIPPEIRNGGQEWVEGHYMYRIERGTTWSR